MERRSRRKKANKKTANQKVAALKTFLEKSKTIPPGGEVSRK